MSQFDLNDILVAVIITAIVTAALVGFIASGVLQRKDDRWSKKYFQVTKESFVKSEEIHRLSSHFDARVEKEVRARISEWEPDQRSADEAFEEADRMAKLRKQRDAGRSHPPRPDGGAPASVHRLTLKR